MFKKWREKHPKKIKPFDAEEIKLQKYLASLDCGTEEYREALNEQRSLYENLERSRESRRKLNKEGRASVWTKIIGGVGTLLGIGALGYYEMKGNTFSGEKRKLADGLSNLVSGFLRNKG